MCTIKEALLLSSTASLVSISTAASRGHSGASGAGGYASPDFSRPSTSGYRKKSNRYRRLSVAPLAGVERRGRGTLGSGGLNGGFQIPFRWAPTLSRDSIPLPAYAPSSIRGKALEGELQALLDKGAIELAPLPSPGFYSRLFMVMKASRAWRPVIDLSTLNLWIQQTSFRWETLQSVLLSVRPGDWMVSLDLMDAYLQVPCTRFHASSSGSWWGGRCTSSRYFASAFPRLRKFLPGSWLLYQRFYTGGRYDFVAPWATGRIRLLAPEVVERSIIAWELLVIERALKWFAPLLAGSSVAVFADNSTAVSYLRNQGGTRSSFLTSIA